MSASLDRQIADLEVDLAHLREERGNPLPGMEDQGLDDYIARLERVLESAKEEATLEVLAAMIFEKAAGNE